MRLELGDGYAITGIHATDKAAYIRHLNDAEIYRRTLNIPFPYDEAAADSWLRLVEDGTKANDGRPVSFGIRDAGGTLVGGVGFDGLVIGKAHKAEIGYWLARPYWGKGIMSQAVKAICDYAFREFGLEKVTAHIFAFNMASQRVLEKNGFIQEGTLTRHYRKDGELFDGKLFAKFKDESEARSGRPDFVKSYRDIQGADDSHYDESHELHAICSDFTKELGLSKIGIGIDTLPPGRRTSWPHAHSREEEFVYVIEGYPDAWVDGHLHRLGPGDGVGFPSGTGITHTFINNTQTDVRLLIVGERIRPGDTWFYPLNSQQNEKIS